MGVYIGTSELKNAYIGEYRLPYLCFTAGQANSTVQLAKTGSPTEVTLETSTDGSTWATYTIGDTITLANVGDKVYWRNTSDTVTNFSKSVTQYYKYVMTGEISASGDCNFLLCKDSTDTLPNNYCFYNLFRDCTVLVSAPLLSATTITPYCYNYMFYGCSSLAALPSLPAITLKERCYSYMFDGCSSIKLSTTQTGEYQTEYRIPTTGTGTTASNDLSNMFIRTGGTYASTPTINTTYYTSNTVV